MYNGSDKYSNNKGIPPYTNSLFKSQKKRGCAIILLYVLYMYIERIYSICAVKLQIFMYIMRV